MMVKFKKLTMRNFLSIGNATVEVDLEHPGTMLILGNNIDTGQRNGAGKTVISNALSYVLFNKPLDAIGKEKLINSTNISKKTEMGVMLNFSIGETEYFIKRGRGAEYDARIFINGQDVTPDSIDNINKKIVEIIGISYELFRRTVVFRGSDQPFFEMPVSQQRSLIEELFKISVLSEKAEILKKKSIQTDKDLSVLQAQIQLKEKAAENLKQRVKDAEARVLSWEASKKASREKLESDLKASSSLDFEEQEKLITEYSEAFEIYQQADSERLSISQILAEDFRELTKVKKELEHLRDQKCPYCLQSFEGGQAKILDLEKKEIELFEKSKELETVVEDLEKVVLEYGKKFADIKVNLKVKDLTDLHKLKAGISVLEEKIRANEESKNPHIEVYEKALLESPDFIDYSKLDELKSILEHQKFLAKLLTDKNSFIRKNIIGRNLPFLNSRLHKHSRDLGLPHVVSFNSDMGCSISQFGRELDYGNLSGGEKKRLNLALSRSFRDVSQYLHTTFNFLLLDEVDGGAMDEAGVYAIINTLKELSAEDKNLAIWIISHRPECLERFDRCMTVKLESGFTSIESIIER